MLKVWKFCQKLYNYDTTREINDLMAFRRACVWDEAGTFITICWAPAPSVRNLKLVSMIKPNCYLRIKSTDTLPAITVDNFNHIMEQDLS